MQSLSALFMRELILLDQGHTLMTSYNLNYFFTPNTATMGIMTSTYEGGVGGEPQTFSP